MRWEPLIAAHRRVLFVPSWDCASGADRRFVEEAVLAASASRTEVSSFHNGRPVRVDCAGELRALEQREQPDSRTLVVILGEAAGPRLSGIWRCARFTGGRACSAEPRALLLLESIGSVASPRVPAAMR
jgi:hypothetical protein